VSASNLHINCLCFLSLLKLQISDAYCLQIQHLDNTIDDSDHVMIKSENCLADCHILLQVLKKKYHDDADVFIAKLYYNVFQISITHDNQAQASIFAEREHKLRVICEKKDSSKMQKMKNLMKNSAGH